ncbi:MAG: TIGR03643 family protein [Cytophagaceae bacterium]|nr:TIGR03643 family protein [Cytophagaceae bacterium]
MVAEELICHYSGLPSPLWYEEQSTRQKKNVAFTPQDLNRIIEMAWEDRTPFDAIFIQFGVKESEVKDLMKKNISLSSYKRWRIRVGKCHTKHAGKRAQGINRFKCNLQRHISLNKVSKRP